jgi:hypothetical protein
MEITQNTLLIMKFCLRRFVYFGKGTTLLNFNGSVCSSPSGVNCQEANSSPDFQSNATVEQARIAKDVKYAEFYPILRIGLSYKF